MTSRATPQPAVSLLIITSEKLLENVEWLGYLFCLFASCWCFYLSQTGLPDRVKSSLTILESRPDRRHIRISVEPSNWSGLTVALQVEFGL